MIAAAARQSLAVGRHRERVNNSLVALKRGLLDAGRPVPQLDGPVLAAADERGAVFENRQGSDPIAMSFESGNRIAAFANVPHVDDLIPAAGGQDAAAVEE